ncbi:MAG: 50S ribosomal protein L18 [Chloroflexota bacterium]|nr:MAG: 50S ribosomal protein L18 [Chloroflexota bacterium]
MAKKKSRSVARERRHFRVRRKVHGTPERPRLNVYRSLNEIYAQVIDDLTACTLVSASTIDTGIRDGLNGLTKMEQAHKVGQAIAERALDKGIQKVVFDSGGYKYIGRVKALAEGAREGGLQF